MTGIIIKAISGEYDVIIDEKRITCKPLGVFRHLNLVPKVGDFVDVDGNKIVKIHPRKNDLTRPFVSNVDKVFIITSFTEPSLNLNLLDRLITLIHDRRDACDRRQPGSGDRHPAVGSGLLPDCRGSPWC
ncbi:MAG: GTPase RsgA, partial [Bacilli bacterium]|nr:GTPase RsgA [Bacilli bacterium]